jgi:hypothetical protein
MPIYSGLQFFRKKSFRIRVPIGYHYIMDLNSFKFNVEAGTEVPTLDKVVTTLQGHHKLNYNIAVT